MNRTEFLDRLDSTPWDIVIIGGGATGLGAALDATSRGYRTLLLEAADFAQATSSRSTKLIHGGVRYLQQGNVSLVRESLHERGLLLRSAPELVRPLQFILPTRSFTETLYYGAGLKVYDLLSGRLKIQASRRMARSEIQQLTPGLDPQTFTAGLTYYDAQFDDAQLAIAVARKVAELGGTLINNIPVTSLLKQSGRIEGVVARDLESDREYQIRSRVVINATGIFSDTLRRMDDPHSHPLVALSQGVHLVLPRRFFPGDAAVIIPKTVDGRVLFFIPWHGAVLVGTTDIPRDKVELEPRPSQSEIDYLLDYAGQYFLEQPGPKEILSMFAGLRPLVRRDDSKSTAQLSRDHLVQTSSSGLITIVGGKWTTFRKMGMDVVEQAIRVSDLEHRPSTTVGMNLNPPDMKRSVFDEDESAPPSEERIVCAVREEMARHVGDVLARRTRLLFLNVQAAIEAAPQVARIMARELGRDDEWVRQEIESFERLAENYRAP